ncbi:hypothetical protein SAMN03080615_01648 [Amphritea atlantica]|uniref:Uncharacterized protein n=1 Tax=Amphritea atlantica TaxID=355243 RepID=A0A1H9GFC5_9GAMM|nr:hypothetical protein [Amphritea atlantica]SEQ48759.1 hypothetical protein SAMN03080615_01648 [Amphritea atlantica]
MTGNRYVLSNERGRKVRSRVEVMDAKQEGVGRAFNGEDVADLVDEFTGRYQLTAIERGLVKKAILYRLRRAEGDCVDVSDLGSGYLFLQRVPFSEFAEAITTQARG